MTARIAIDLNVRVRGNQTYASFADVEGDLVLGERVEVHEPESGLVGLGRVADVDPKRELVFLDVDWSSLHESTTVARASAPKQPEFCLGRFIR